MGARKTWRGAVVDAATDRLALIAFLFASSTALLFYLVAPNSTMPIWIAVVLTIVLLLVIFVVLQALRIQFSASASEMPRLITVIGSGDGEELPILLLEASELFGTENFVSIYHKDDANGFEVLVGYGYVRTVQLDQKIQVQVLEWFSGNDDITDKIEGRVVDALNCTIVRPSAPRTVADRMNDRRIFSILNSIKLEGAPPLEETGVGDE